MRRTLMNRRVYYVLLALIAVALVTIHMSSDVKALDELLKWKKLDTMDTSFNIVQNKAGYDDILLHLDMEDPGTYNLTYYLEDGRQTEIIFNQTYENLGVEYHIHENDGFGGSMDITQAEVSQSYLEVNYGLTVPDWEFDGTKLVGASGGLEYTINRSGNNQYPGVAFEVNNKRVLIKWDFQSEEAYVLVNDYEDGKIMPVTYVTPNKGTKSIKVLKQLEDLNISPTHYITTDGAFNVQVNPVFQPDPDEESPGRRPGLDITFKQPKEMNPVTWQYEYGLTDLNGITAIFELDDVGTDAYFDFNIELQTETDFFIKDIDVEGPGINDDVVYLYDPVTYEYTIHMVQDKSPLAQQETFIQWSELAASSFYDVNVGFQPDIGPTTYEDYEFTNYGPPEGFAATFMAYELKRATVEEAYLEVTPFNAGQQEEIEYTILYSKVIKETLDTDEDLWLKNYHTASGEDDEIFIPVPFRSTSSQDAYQIVVTFAGTEIYSQVLNYRAVDDKDVPPSLPDIEIIENLFVVPPLTEGDDLPERVKFDMTWTALTNDEIKELDTVFEDLNGLPDDFLYYEVSVNKVPNELGNNLYEVIKVFEVTKTGDDYAIDLFEPTPGPEDGPTTLNFLDGYNETDELFRINDITIRDAGSWSSVLTAVADDDTNTYTITDTGIEADFEFPGVNYIRIRAIAIKDGELSVSDMSIPESLSLSLTAYDVPIVDTLIYEPLYGVEEDRTSGITLEWQTVDTDNYETFMLTPISKQIKETIYTVYISEEQADILPLQEDANYVNIIPESANQVTIDAGEIAQLREGEVLYFDVYDTGTDTLTVDIQGLDVNADYNIRMVTKLEINDNPDMGAPDEYRRSEPSSVLGATVPKAPDEPGDEEIRPLAPEFLLVTFADESFSNAQLEWTLPAEMIFGEDENGFEVLAIEDRSLPAELVGPGTTLQEILSSELLSNDVVEAWRIYEYNGELIFRKYDEDTGTYVDMSQDLIARENNVFTMIDNSNAPNKVNYYYVRTVSMEAEQSRSASVWTLGTLTTAPVKGPINLTVDYTSGYTYDPTTEFIIHFDAPISDVDQLGVDYIMEIFVKGEADKDYSLTKYPTAYVGFDDTGATGFTRLYYRVTELKPGKTYNIKVRVEDRTQEQELLPDGTLAYPRSPFTEVVTSRTEFDQESYDKENKYNEYLAYYDDKALELKQILFFHISGAADETVVKYRENYSEGVVQLATNSDLNLFSADDAVNTYYIPSSTMELINDRNVTLVIESKEQLVGIRPDTIGEGLTNEVTKIVKDIQTYNSNNEDYYIRIKVYTDDYNGTINGLNPEGPLVELNFAVVGATVLEEQMDELMVAALDTVIKANRSEVIRRLDEELEQGINESELLAVVQEVVEQVRVEYEANASIIFKGYLDDTYYNITEIDEAVYIALKPEDTTGSHTIYTRSGSTWQNEPSNFFNNRYYVETRNLEPFIPVSSTQANTELKDLYGEEAVGVINTYDLTSVFSSYDLGNKDEYVDGYQWINSIARLVGARPGQDNASYLQAREIHAPNSGLYNSIHRDEALMMYVEAYAYRHQIDLDSTYIKDYSIIEDINDVDPDYRLPLIRAANLQILPLTNGMVNPKASLTMKQALDLLIDLDKGLE